MNKWFIILRNVY